MKKFIAYFIILGTIYWSFSNLMPSYSKKDKTTSSSEFSIQNSLFHLKNISQKAHHVGTKAHKEVQNYIVDEFKKMGLSPTIQTQTAFNKNWAAGTTVENILVRIRGTGNGKALLLLSHYDSNPHSAIGASDAGSGVVTIMEGIRAYLTSGKKAVNDIIILISDAEELGLLGAQAFVDHHPWAKDVALVLNFEARGSGGPSYMLLETNGKNSRLIKEFIKANPKFPVANSLLYSIYKMLPNDTDLTVFRETANINGFNFAFIDDHFDYHTAQDSYERLDRETLAHQASYFSAMFNYFKDTAIENLDSDKDLVYVNFPFVKMITYPFGWKKVLFLGGLFLFIMLLFIGIKKKKLIGIDILKGFIPLLLSLIISAGFAYLFWMLAKIIHPSYKDMLHGFTYNGHDYIVFIVCITLWIAFKIYNSFTNIRVQNLLVAPIFLWLLVNYSVFGILPGASFFIIPVYIALCILSFFIFTKEDSYRKPILFAVVSIPTLYIFTPFIKTFPVGLGLKILFVSAIFTFLVFSVLLPIFYIKEKKTKLHLVVGFLAIVFLIKAEINSGFSKDKKLPNSLVYMQDTDSKTSYWGTYNNVLDDYTKQVLGENPTEGSIQSAETKSKYNTRFRYHKKAPSYNFETSTITIKKDTLVGKERMLSFSIVPNRKLNKIELATENTITFNQLLVNNADANRGKPYVLKRSGTFFVYHMANNDNNLDIELKFNSDEKLNIILNEISYDLLKNNTIKLQPRADYMMPMPFVTNDAILINKKLQF